MGQGILYIIGDILSLLTISTCIYCKVSLTQSVAFSYRPSECYHHTFQVPQIQSVRAYRSAEGLSVTGLIMETCSYTVSMLYNYTNGYAILNYLEYPILLLQEYALVYFVLLYKGLFDVKNTKLFIGLYWGIFFLFALRLAPAWILVGLIPCTTPVSATSKVMQLVAILRTKDSQTISLMTWFISAFTNLSKIESLI